MKSSYILNLSKFVSDSIYASVDNNCLEKNLCKDENVGNKTGLEQSKNVYLGEEVIRKIIYKFLIEKKMTIKRLTKILEIRLVDFKRFIFQKEISSTFTARFIEKINLPLIKLYCKTKFK